MRHSSCTGPTLTFKSRVRYGEFWALLGGARSSEGTGPSLGAPVRREPAGASGVRYRTHAMPDETDGDGLRERLTRQGEDALGRLAQDLLENPLVHGAIARAFGAREKAAQAQEVAFGALNIPSAADLERLTRRVRSLSQRLEGIEDGVDRLDERLAGIQTSLDGVTKALAGLREATPKPAAAKAAPKPAAAKAAPKPAAAKAAPSKKPSARAPKRAPSA
jgi:hypothetical protein